MGNRGPEFNRIFIISDTHKSGLFHNFSAAFLQTPPALSFKLVGEGFITCSFRLERELRMRRNTLLALVTWLMVVAFFVVAATAAGRMKAMEHEIDSLPCRCCWIVRPGVCGHSCCGDNCCP
ncbi:uncharacterized protein LOC103710687 [Phoenix dactylifera]|uniref:Uncharacterized protein LOC103710687 n=1 Tax=Phoenix dactylifera TaxID=42345 RepID=A0A8B9A1A6_PHODC|nr:uncharacterized protein LOC103710687 [Phoenix dactylifera]